MKTKRILSLFIGFMLALGAQAVPQANDFFIVDSRYGLSQNNVKSIAQDDYGFIWLGTKNGLCRYDGRQTRLVRVMDYGKGRGNQNISALQAEDGHLLWVGTDEGLFLYDESTDLFHHIETVAQDGQQMTNWVGDVQHDRLGNVWVIVPGEGMFRIDCADRKGAKAILEAPLRHYPNPGHDNDQHFTCFCITPRGEVWVSGWNIGLWRYNTKTDRFEQLQQDVTGRSLLGIQFNTITPLADGALAMAVQDGHVMLYSPLKGELTENPWQDFSATVVRGATAYGDQLLVGTYNGLFRIDTTTGDVALYQHDRNSLRSLPDDIIYTTFRDREGGYWIGTMFGGAAYMPAREQMFTVVKADNDGSHLSSDRIRQITTDGGQNLWLCTEDGGINHIDLRTRRITPLVGRTGNPNDNFTVCLTYYQGKLYAGINKTGVKVIDTRTGETELVSDATLGLPRECSVYDICYDAEGTAWVGTDRGAWRGRPNNECPLMPVRGTEEFWIYDILHDHEGNVWMALMGGGVARVDAKGGKMHRYEPDPKHPGSLPSNAVSAVFEDSKGNIWFATDRGGICRYRPETDDFQRFSTEEGLPDNVAYDILEDAHGRLWFGTNQGLVQLNPETGHIHVFTTAQGLPSNQFNYKAALAMPNGGMFFGTINGLVYCQSGKVVEVTDAGSAEQPRLLITRLSIDGQDVTPQTQGSPLRRSIMETDRIVLPYKHANINLDVALLSYGSGRETLYEYRLEPIDAEWHPVPDGGISLASLASGKYTLRLRSSDLSSENAPHEECTLGIVVRPPLWRSWWAILLYLLAIGLIAGIWFRWYRLRKEQQFQERQRLFAIEKEKELGEKKVQFFTEIAHEIRTPLTLINGPLEMIEEKGVQDEQVKRNLSVIHQNTNRLLNLASQLLDFQKLGTGEMKPQLDTVNISELLRETLERFEPTFALRGKQLTSAWIDSDILAQVDREAVTKILSNLINNALKYGDHRCEVKLTREDDHFLLSVFSDGTPIPADRREAIFDPFVQLKSEAQAEPVGGVGIGLALCRSLAVMHGGSLVVEGREDGNEFLLSLPLGEVGTLPAEAPSYHAPQPQSEEAPAPEEAAEETVAPENVPLSPDATLGDDGLMAGETMRGSTILLVEDEQGIRDFISERLREDFLVETAENGQLALEKLGSTHVDLVITDMMMPVMDGVELCRRIKQDVERSHIPIIFLTAKNDLNSKIAGLRVGAEAYVEKPFAWDFLRQQVISLLSNRQKEREAFARRPFFPMKSMQMSQEDKEFMERAMAVINEHLSDETFNVEAMADALYMSRSSLLRKIKTLFDMPPLDFIRLIRLKKAAELIQDGRYRMGEICEKVGFSNHSYFSKLFCKQFGMTPKDFEKQVEEQRTKTRKFRQS